MESLDQYLTDQFHLDTRDLDEVEGVLLETSKTLIDAYDDQKGWPYKIDGRSGREWPPKDEKTGKEKISHSTTAMVLLAVSKLLGERGKLQSRVKAPQFPKLYIDQSREDALRTLQTKAFGLLTKAIKLDGKVTTSSGTYGTNDVFTLTYLTDLCGVDLPKEVEHAWQTVREWLETRRIELISLSPSRDQKQYLTDLRPGSDVVPNAFVPLRAVQAIRATNEAQDLPEYRRYFETTIHNQLSFTSIPDSRFDPAELTFCLEGLMLSQSRSADQKQHSGVDQSVFTRVVEVLTKAQEESAYWRPAKPFLASAQGMALFPISVEVANSLLRSCELADGRGLYDTFGSRTIGLFRRYWRWLRARTVRFRQDTQDYVGWHSEHVNDPSLIHIWETSQVIEFLLNFRRLLQAHIARTTLIRSRFTIRFDKPKLEWKKVVEKYEPVTILGDRYQVYKRIDEDFFEGWEKRHPKNYSMLLYGPPGTGKTTVAENLADALEFPMITITVSDFLAGGGSHVEARAKAIFDVLRSQSECLILFDEIDHFLLDRDSALYSHQDTVFQFMTPGMLAKLNELRRAKRVLFVVATNYENRIDPAIKRTGRIDHKYLVLPPDMAARRRIIKKLLDDALMDPLSELQPSSIQDGDWTKLTDASLFLGYKDIDGSIDEALRNQPNVATLVKILSDRARTTDLSIYANKLDDCAGSPPPPMEEFLCLLGLALQLNDQKSEFLNKKRTIRAIENAANLLKKEVNGEIDHAVMSELVEKQAPNIDANVAKRIASRLLKA